MNTVNDDMLNKPANQCKDMGCISTVLVAKGCNVISEKACFMSKHDIYKFKNENVSFMGHSRTRFSFIYFKIVQIWVRNFLHIEIKSFMSNITSDIMILPSDTLRSNSAMGISSYNSIK
jgi:hypothetical protein